MNAMLSIVLFLLLGMGCGFLVRHLERVRQLADRSGMVAVYVLLFILGAKLGIDASLFARLPEFGLVAAVLTLCCSLGSVLFVWLAGHYCSWFSFGPCELKETKKEEHAPSPFGGSIKILLCFILGVTLARWGLLPLWLCDDQLAEYALWVLIFTVGIGLGSGVEVFFLVRTMKGKLLCVPLFIIIGTLFGGACAAFLLPHLTIQETLSASAGFGYYSLSSLIIGETGRAALASIALLSNIMRELLGILSAQPLARFCGPLAPIAVAGATAMDTCLPVIARFSGPSFVVVAVFSGMLLSLLVPFLVTFILAF